MVTITASDVFGDSPADPLESERFISDYINDLADEALAHVPQDTIVNEARSRFPNAVEDQKAHVVSRTCEWFSSNVVEDGFDTDVYQASQREVVSTILRALGPATETSSFKRTETVY